MNFLHVAGSGCLAARCIAPELASTPAGKWQDVGDHKLFKTHDSPYLDIFGMNIHKSQTIWGAERCQGF